MQFGPPHPSRSAVRWALRILGYSALAILAAVEIRRARDLLRQDPGSVSTRDERTWRAWSERYPGLEGKFSAIEEQLAVGERIALVVPDGSDLAEWWRAQVLYHLPRQTLASVVDARDAALLPRAWPRLFVDDAGDLALRRPARRARARS